MVCDCCGRKKKLFESYAAIAIKQGKLNLCVECNDLAYKVRDDANELNKNGFEKHMKEWKRRAKKPSESFIEWQKKFVAPLEAKFQEDKNTAKKEK